MSFNSSLKFVLHSSWFELLNKSFTQNSYIQQLREGVHNFFVTFIEVLRDRPLGHDWEL